jgi:hypothetical protein
MSTSVLASVISSLVAGLVSAAIARWWSARGRADAVYGELRYGSGLAVLGVGCLAVASFAAVTYLLDAEVRRSPGGVGAGVVLVAGFGLGAVYCLAEYLFVRGSYDDEGIELAAPWTGQRREKWRDLQSVTYSAPMRRWVLKFRSGRVMRVSRSLRGYAGVLETLAESGFTLE